MSDQAWRGLHNRALHVVGRVTGTRVCLRCSDLSASGAWECQPNDQCPCCLATEVEALRAQVQRVREVSTSRMPATPPGMDTGSYRFGGATLMSQVLTALDGGDE